MPTVDPPVRAATLLDLADRAELAAPVERALAIVEVAGVDIASLRRGPIGDVHAALLRFRRAMSGPGLDSVVTCPTCGEEVEFAVDVDALLALGTGGGPASGSTTRDGCTAAWHAPTAEDLIAASTATDAAAELRRRCLEVGRDGDDVDPADAPPGLVDAVEAAMADADPLAEVLVGVACPACGARFDADLDPVAFVWAEVLARGRRVLVEVDALARAYGWTEAEVLALPEARRAAYLSLVWEGTP